ncbi:hypothetical protein [Pontibacter liquoris]|uniref:hypothetical protein n=1 Tax=Pontibacter liquoris TaxID=2905677 RepID=UPI001FA7ECF3|nr:hypothetical protein [Pontibacter liquoris]
MNSIAFKSPKSYVCESAKHGDYPGAVRLFSVKTLGKAAKAEACKSVSLLPYLITPDF